MEPLLILSYFLIFLIIFTQLSLPFGIIFPGTSLLLTVGLLASEQDLGITTLLIVTSLASLLGDSFGYYLGKKFGPRLLSSRNTLRAQAFYRKYGPATIIFARFVHFARTFAPNFAAIGKMPYSKFLFYSFIGTLLWALVVPFLGYHFGVLVPAQYIRYLVITLVTLLALSAVRHYIQFRRSK